MPDKPTPKQLREFAAKLVREAHDDYDFMSIGEQMDSEPFAGLTEEQFDAVQTAISDLISSAVVTVSWPDEQPQDDTDAARLAQIRDRSERLAEIPLETAAGNYIMRDMIDSIGDVRWLLERQDRTDGPESHAGGLALQFESLAKGESPNGPQNAATGMQPDDVPNDLWWPFTGGADVCYLEHDDNGVYRDCCMRAGLAYALKVHEEQVRAQVAAEPQNSPLTAAELAELTASIDHLSGPDAWDEARLEPALIPVTHYVPRLLVMVAKVQQDDRAGAVRDDAFDLDCEELVEIFADFIGQWDRSHEVITVGLPDYLPQLRIPHLRRAVVALQRLGRERGAARDARDGDVRAVAALLKLGDTSFRGNWLTDYDDARSELESRFADRIAALEACDAKAAPKRTPEQWCEQYGVDVIDPDGWRGKDDPPWTEPITLADFYERAIRSTVRNVPGVDWERIRRDAKAAS